MIVSSPPVVKWLNPWAAGEGMASTSAALAAVARHQISDRRYQSYLGQFHNAGEV